MRYWRLAALAPVYRPLRPDLEAPARRGRHPSRAKHVASGPTLRRRLLSENEGLVRPSHTGGACNARPTAPSRQVMRPHAATGCLGLGLGLGFADAAGRTAGGRTGDPRPSGWCEGPDQCGTGARALGFRNPTSQTRPGDDVSGRRGCREVSLVVGWLVYGAGGVRGRTFVRRRVREFAGLCACALCSCRVLVPLSCRVEI